MSTPGGIRGVAEHTFALLRLARQVPRLDKPFMKVAGKNLPLRYEVRGKTLGLIGSGESAAKCGACGSL